MFVPGSAGRARRCPRGSTLAPLVRGRQWSSNCRRCGRRSARTKSNNTHDVTSYSSPKQRPCMCGTTSPRARSRRIATVTLALEGHVEHQRAVRLASLAESPHLDPLWQIFLHLTALHSSPPCVKRDGQLLRARSFSCGYHILCTLTRRWCRAPRVGPPLGAFETNRNTVFARQRARLGQKIGS